MKSDELERSDKLGTEYHQLMNQVISMHEKITKVHGFLWAALEYDHNVSKFYISQARAYARKIDEEFTDGIEYAIKCHVEKVDELDEDILADTFDPVDNGISDKDFGGPGIRFVD